MPSSWHIFLVKENMKDIRYTFTTQVISHITKWIASGVAKEMHQQKGKPGEGR